MNKSVTSVLHTTLIRVPIAPPFRFSTLRHISKCVAADINVAAQAVFMALDCSAVPVIVSNPGRLAEFRGGVVEPFVLHTYSND